MINPSYYIFDPNNGEFISGPFTCKNLARRSIRPQAGAPENQPYIVVQLFKDDILLKKVDYSRKNFINLIEKQELE